MNNIISHYFMTVIIGYEVHSATEVSRIPRNTQKVFTIINFGSGDRRSVANTRWDPLF